MEPQWVIYTRLYWGAGILPCHHPSSGPYNYLTSLSWLVTSISIAQRQLWGSHFCDKRPMWSKKAAVSLGDSRRMCFTGKPLRSLTVKKPVQPKIYISNSIVFLSYWTSVHDIIISTVSVSLQILGSISPSAALLICCEPPSTVSWGQPWSARYRMGTHGWRPWRGERGQNTLTGLLIFPGFSEHLCNLR